MADYSWEDVKVPKKRSRKVFDARFDGWCAAGDAICAGEAVCYVGDELMHEDCALEDEQEQGQPFCGSCNTYHNGECL